MKVTTDEPPGKPAIIVDQTLRVLIVAASLDIMGGQAVQAAKLVHYLKEEPTVTVGFLPVNPRLPGVLRKLQSVKYLRTITTSILYWVNLLKTVPKFDVIHIFSASYLSFLLAPTPAILVGRIFGKRIILNYHSGEAEEHLRLWPRSSMPLLRIADEIIVPSNYLVRVFAQFGLIAKAIFNVIELDQLVFRERRPLSPVFLSNRNFQVHYGVDTVLRAFAIIQERFAGASLTVIGDGPCHPALIQLSTELQLENVRFTGTIEHDRMPMMYNESDIFLNASRLDNQPLSILEAFASGLPVITSDAGGIPDMVINDKTGFIVPINDHVALARKAIQLVEEPSIAQGVVAQARRECWKYTWGAVRDEWLTAYTGTLDQSAKNSRLVQFETHQAPKKDGKEACEIN